MNPRILSNKLIASTEPFEFGPCGIFRFSMQRQILTNGTKQDAHINPWGFVEPLVMIPGSHLAIVDFHHLFYPFLKGAQGDGHLDREGVVVVHVDTHDDLNPAEPPAAPIQSFRDAITYMNQKLNEANFLYPLLSDPTIDEIISIGNGGRHHILPINMRDLPDILERKFKGAANSGRRLAWSIDLDAFAHQDYFKNHTEPEWTRWQSRITFIQYRLNLPLWLDFVSAVRRLQSAGIESRCVVIATSTHTPTMATDDHFEYLACDLAQELLGRTIDLFEGKEPEPFDRPV